MKKYFRIIFSDFGRISCDFRLDIRDFGKKCEIKGNKEKSRESGGSGQGKQPWGVGRYDIAVSALLLCLVSMDYPHGVSTRL